jgi:hypothetical protein
MLYGHEIETKIPAYDFRTIVKYYGDKAKEELEKYKVESTKDDKHEVVKTIKHMIKNYKNRENVIFALNAILNDENLLNKTKLTDDGSFKNMRICALDSDDKYCDKFTILDINWRNVIKDKSSFYDEGQEWFNKIIRENDIMELLNNIEEIFIQP